MSTREIADRRRTPKGRGSFRRSAAGGLACIALALAAATEGCGGDSNSGSAAPAAAAGHVSPPAAIKSRGQISFCTEGDYPPLTFTQGGQLTGSDIDIGAAVAKMFGVKPVFNRVAFDSLIPALQGKKCDVVASGLSVTPERQRQVGFAVYVNAPQAIMVKKGNPLKIHAPEDLTGKAVSVLTGTNGLEALHGLNDKFKAAGKAPMTIGIFKAEADAVQALGSGKSDAYISGYAGISALVSGADAKFSLSFVAPASMVTPTQYGLATRKEEGALQQALTQAVRKLYSEGAMAQILEKWHLPSFALSEAEQSKYLSTDQT